MGWTSQSERRPRGKAVDTGDILEEKRVSLKFTDIEAVYRP